MAIFAATGVIFAAYYMLPMVQKVFFNALDKPENREMKDLSAAARSPFSRPCSRS